MEFDVKVQVSNKNVFISIPRAIIRNFDVKKGQKATYKVTGETITISFEKEGETNE